MRQMIIVVLVLLFAGFYNHYYPSNVYAEDPTANIEQSPASLFSRGAMYAEGLGVPQDYAEAAKWYRMAADMGEAAAQLNLGVMYEHGQGVPQDYKEAEKWYRMAAVQGFMQAQFNLGLMYSLGMGVPQDYIEAAKWLRMAAEQGKAGAQYLLGLMFDQGLGVKQDNIEAAKWYRMAAEQGNAGAQRMLGVMYYAEGYGVQQDNIEAAKWFRMAAEQGNAGAQFNLGVMYEHGEGVPQDHKEAAKWYRMAAEQGNAGAQFNLGVMYLGDCGLQQDFTEAARWFRLAAVQGEAQAMRNLGLMYDKGDGVLQNYILAYAWFNLAATQDQEDAPHNRDIVAEKMTASQIAEAQALSAQLQQEINRSSAAPAPATLAPETSGIPDLRPKGSGSGFIITKDGYVLTCQHVIDNADSIEVAIEDHVYPAKLIREDKHNDLALLKISGTFPPLAFSSNRSAQMGQEVFTIGYPNPILQGSSAKLTKGTVASLAGFQDDLRLYQISVPVQPGNSGGPLLDLSGNIIGVIVAILDAKIAFDVSGSLPQNVNYAVKSSYAQALLDALPEVSEELPPPYQGQPFADVVNRVNKSAVMVIIY
jgi:hypothetical protein